MKDTSYIRGINSTFVLPVLVNSVLGDLLSNMRKRKVNTGKRGGIIMYVLILAQAFAHLVQCAPCFGEAPLGVLCLIYEQL
jgi:hypothetical protein